MSAIRPPDESITRPRSSEVVNNGTGKNLKRRIMDVWLGAVIFIAAIVEFISWYIPQGDDYLLFWYPFLVTLNFLNLSTFFIVKAFRYNSCIYSKIASVSYSLLHVISLIALLYPGSTVQWMLMFAYPVIIISILISTLILIIKWRLRKSA